LIARAAQFALRKTRGNMRTVRSRWVDVVGLIFTVVASAALMFALLPQRTLPGEQVVPPLPAGASDPTQAFLTLFVVMTTVGAPVTIAIVLALIVRGVSKRLASADATAKSAQLPAKPAAGRSAVPLSPREERFWKIVATLLILGISGGVLAAVWPDLVRLFSR
jgi:hypothetical protein